MSILILNQSTVVSDDDVALWRDAIGLQIRYHVSAGWNVECPHLHVISSLDEVTPEDKIVVILDDSDHADYLGYHAQTPDGREYARVFAKTSLDNGVPASVVLSHEICEMTVDGDCNRWALGPRKRRLWAIEICDPCESSWYTMDGTDVSVSDFVKPSFFDPSGDGETVVTHLGGKGVFTVQPGGYAIVWHVHGNIKEIFGDAYPEWKRESKRFAAARTHKRKDTEAGQ